MRISDPKPMPLTPRARLLRELATLQKMSRYLRTKAAPLLPETPPEEGPDEEEEENAEPKPPSIELASDLPLCALFDMLIEQGRELVEKIDTRPEAIHQRRTRGSLSFMDLVYAAKTDFFHELNDIDERHTV
jgi:chromatin segregation and condensation protein Rec8/ScpA/Scc1 (kleisin family)